MKILSIVQQQEAETVRVVVDYVDIFIISEIVTEILGAVVFTMIFVTLTFASVWFYSIRKRYGDGRLKAKLAEIEEKIDQIASARPGKSTAPW